MEIIYTEKKYKGERFVQIKLDRQKYGNVYYATYKFLTHKIGHWGVISTKIPYYRIYQNKTEYRVSL